MTDRIIVLRTYASEVEAQVDAAILEANEIPAQVSSDTAGGAIPSMSLLFPVRLLVREEDEGVAREVLDTPASATPEDVEG